jgi:hypothetical protein
LLKSYQLHCGHSSDIQCLLEFVDEREAAADVRGTSNLPNISQAELDAGCFDDERSI